MSAVHSVQTNALVAAGGVAAARHDGDDDDGDEEPQEDGGDADLVEHRHGAVGEAHGRAGKPGGQDVDDENVPGLGDEGGVVDGVHLHDRVGEDGPGAGGAEDPGQVVPPAGEEADGAPPSLAPGVTEAQW